MHKTVLVHIKNQILYEILTRSEILSCGLPAVSPRLCSPPAQALVEQERLWLFFCRISAVSERAGGPVGDRAARLPPPVQQGFLR